MNKWVRRLRHACRLKTSEKEGYTNGGADENSHPGAEEANSDLDIERLESDENESSPTLSSSGPYIPISECFSGKPMIFNDAGEIDTRYYNTTNFPFPPEVNWSTHPAKKEIRSMSTTNSKVGPPAPPRPPKKQSGSGSSASSNPVTGNKARKGSKSSESSKHPTPVPLPPASASSAPRSVFRYDNFEEVHPDSSSTCSSLQSPPGSAGALYTNLSDLNTLDQNKELTPGPIYQNPPKLRPPNSQANPLPSSPAGEQESGNESPAPTVNRSLKPDLKKDGEFSPTQRTGFQHSSGSMTLPSPRHSNFSSHRSNPHRAAIPAIVVGPCIDRSQKPQESPLTLGPTPAQVKSQAGAHSHSRSHSSTSAAHFHSKSTTSTLPSSPRRRAGPMISPHDKNKHMVYHEYEQPPDLMGTYLQIDTKLISKGEPGEVRIHSSGPKGKNPKKSPTVGPSEESGSVEYRMIDHLMTKALNQTRQEREELLTNRSNPVPVSKIPN